MPAPIDPTMRCPACGSHSALVYYTRRRRHYTLRVYRCADCRYRWPIRDQNAGPTGVDHAE